MPRAVYRHRMTIQHQVPLGENDYGEMEYGPFQDKYTDVPCLAVPDTRPVAILNAEISEPNRDISRLYWTIDVGQYYIDADGNRHTMEIYSGDRIASVVNRRGELLIHDPLNIIVVGRKWDGWRILAEQHMYRNEP